MTREFRPRLVPTIATVPLFALLVGLGFWQLDRARDKRALLSAYDSPAAATPAVPDPAFERVWLTGEFLTDRQILMDGVAHDERPGFNVLTPLRVEGAELVIVNRGWQPWQTDRNNTQAPPAPAGPVQVSGLLKSFPQSGLKLGDGNAAEPSGWPRIAVYPSPQELSSWLGAPVHDRVLLLDPELPFGFVRDWRPDYFPPERHVGYAVQWFSLALALAVIFVVVNLREKA